MVNQAALIEVRNETLQKIGRNVVNFQKMETMLKFLNAQQAVQGSVSELDAIAAKLNKENSRKPMGQLAETFLKSAYASEQCDPQPASSSGVSVTFSFRIGADSALAAERKKALRSVVRERNKLIHQWLARFDPNSLESCEALSRDLDEQHAKVWPEFEALRAVVVAIREYQREAAQYLSSDAFLAELRENNAST